MRTEARTAEIITRVAFVCDNLFFFTNFVLVILARLSTLDLVFEIISLVL